MANIIFLPLQFIPHRNFTGTFSQLDGLSDGESTIYQPTYEWNDIVPQSQSDHESQPSNPNIFFDFFLLQSTFNPLCLAVKFLGQERHSLVVKVTQKPLFTPHKKTREYRILLVSDFSVPFPLHLWLQHADLLDIWDVVFEDDVLGLHKVYWCPERKSIYSTANTSIHILTRNKSKLDATLKLYLESLE